MLHMQRNKIAFCSHDHFSKFLVCQFISACVLDNKTIIIIIIISGFTLFVMVEVFIVLPLQWKTNQ